MAKYGTLEREQVPTYGHPEGVTVQAKAAPLVADLEASRKVSGFLGHAANLFCSFCLCNHAEIEELDLGDWDERDCELVHQQAEAWLNEPTKARRAILETANGVRWTSLFRLNYWDPTKHVVLGYMHNWLEGILQHHLRNLWVLVAKLWINRGSRTFRPRNSGPIQTYLTLQMNSLICLKRN